MNESEYTQRIDRAMRQLGELGGSGGNPAREDARLELIAAALRNLAELPALETREPARAEQEAAKTGLVAKLGELPAQEARDRANGTEELSARHRDAPERNKDAGALVVVKNSLNGGEISPQMGARFDQQRFESGCHELLNMVPLPCGGITKRPGMEYRGKAGDSRLAPFIFSALEARMLEFYPAGEGVRFRVWFNDGQFLEAGLTLPWRGEWLRDVCFCQSADVLFCASVHFPPCRIERHADDDWRWRRLEFAPAIEPPERISISTGGTWPQGATEWMMRQYAVTSIDGEGNESAPREGFDIWGIPPLSESFYVAIRVTAVPGAEEYRFYRKSAGVYGFVGRCEPAEDGTGYFEDRNISPDTGDTPPEHRNPFAEEYPALVFMHQQRLGFAATDKHPLTVWLSPSGNFESMAASTPPDDDDAIEATLAATQANRILWAISDRAGLALGTAGGEWMLDAPDGSVLTPAAISFQPQTSHGSQPGIMPLRAGASLIFAQRGGQVVRDLGYNFQDDRYRSSDLSLLARHILQDNPVIAWCWQPEPYGIVWCALKDGSMAGLTCLPEQEIIAWHRHSTNGKVLDLSAIPTPSGDWQVWLIIDRQGQKSIETLAPFHNSNPAAATHLDGKEPFPARCTPCLGEIRDPKNATFTRARKINSFKAHVLNAAPFSARISSQDHPDTPDMPVPATSQNFATEALWNCPLASGWRDFPKLTLILDGPNPVTILGLAVTLEYSSEIAATK